MGCWRNWAGLWPWLFWPMFSTDWAYGGTAPMEVRIMTGARRYLRLMGAFARYCLANELAFRGNFIAKIILEVLWLGILLVFYDTIFSKTTVVAGWDRSQYLVFVGCYY